MDKALSSFSLFFGRGILVIIKSHLNESVFYEMIEGLEKKAYNKEDKKLLQRVEAC